jgi:hypothetical protein
MFDGSEEQRQEVGFDWTLLPVEIRLEIIFHFDYQLLCVGSQVCQEWKFFCDDEKLWQRKCREIDVVQKPEARTWKWAFRCRTVPFRKEPGLQYGWMECEEPKGLYFGEWLDTKFHGFGYFSWSQHGLKYMGEYAAGLRHGKGMLVWNNGDRYVGEFEAESKNGKGIFYWSNGDVYNGEYLKDKKHGHGIITWGSHPGECYDGEWSNDKKQGFGKYNWSNGGSYVGYWHDNKRSGRGREVWPSGSIYEGEWLENEMHGWGYKMCTRDGKPDGHYEGPFRDGRAHGRGFRQYQDGATYEGDYVADKRVGYGTYTWPNGDKFSGTWKVGRERGFFVAAQEQSIMFYQEWFEDKLHEDKRTGSELYQVPRYVSTSHTD